MRPTETARLLRQVRRRGCQGARAGAFLLGLALLLVVPLLPGACRARPSSAGPTIEFTRVPAADKGGPDTLDTIEGRVVGARAGQQLVLFSRSGIWWVEPAAAEPFTPIGADSRWRSSTHLGTEYGALLVEPGYHPPSRTDTLPAVGSGVIAVAATPGDPSARAPHHVLQFSGYEWRVRAAPSNRGGANVYEPANAFTDEGGGLHLRISGTPDRWTCSEVSLTRRLGYGTYRIVVGGAGNLEPSAVFSLFTWDGPAAEQNHREVDIEISRWGDPQAPNAQYVVQPYYLPANVARFQMPAGVLTHSLRWEPGRATFTTVRGAGAAAGEVVAQHVFSSGVPPPGNESVRMNLYVFRRGAVPLQKPAEVVVQKFEYVP